MSVKETSEKTRNKLKDIRGNMQGIFRDLKDSAPRPIVEKLGERQTLVLREPIIKTLRSKRKQT